MGEEATTNYGPDSYANWQDFKRGLPARMGEEVLLYSDAHVTNEILEGWGPYQVFNTIGVAYQPACVPVLCLRTIWHSATSFPTLDVNESDTTNYHGGGAEDEIAALIGLALKIRLRPGGKTRDWYTSAPVVYPQPAEGEIPKIEQMTTVDLDQVLAEILLSLVLDPPTPVVEPIAAELTAADPLDVETLKTQLQKLVELGPGVETTAVSLADKAKARGILGEIARDQGTDKAMRDLAARNDLEDITSFCNSLIQADELGTPIGPVLQSQAEMMRFKRFQRAEEAAAKTTIKLVFPLVLFIFPSMFVVILGPAILNIIQSLRGVT